MFSGLSATSHSARRWTALASFILQAVIIAGALVFPMLYPQSLPPAFLDRRIFVPLSDGKVWAKTTPSGTRSNAPVAPTVLVVSRRLSFGEPHPTETDAGPDAPTLGPA